MSPNPPRHLPDEPVADRPYAEDAAETREELRAEVRPLVALHQRTVDALKGYAKMVDKAELEFRLTAEKFRALHERHAAALADLLAELGEEVTPDASMMGNLNQAVVAFRSFVDDIDHDLMPQIRDGEEWVLDAFDEAILAQDDAVAVRLADMRGELDALLAETSHLG